MTHAFRRLALAATALTLLVCALPQIAHAQTVTPTPTKTATPTLTATPTPTPGIPPGNMEHGKERDFSPNAAVDTAAPRIVTIVAPAGAVTDGAVVQIPPLGNSYRIRGLIGSAISSTGTVCKATLKRGTTAIGVISFAGLSGKGNYVRLGSGPTDAIEVPPRSALSLTQNATGTCSGMYVGLDSIP